MEVGRRAVGLNRSAAVSAPVGGGGDGRFRLAECAVLPSGALVVEGAEAGGAPEPPLFAADHHDGMGMGMGTDMGMGIGMGIGMGQGQDQGVMDSGLDAGLLGGDHGMDDDPEAGACDGDDDVMGAGADVIAAKSTSRDRRRGHVAGMTTLAAATPGEFDPKNGLEGWRRNTPSVPCRCTSSKAERTSGTRLLEGRSSVF